MSKQKHTPGPWVVREDPRTFRPSIEKEDRTYFIAHVDECMAKEANARLIAAAPDLLADLREAAATLRRYEALHRAKGTDDSTAKAEVNAALAARFEATIAKATE